jgi:hypothetical protein
MSAEDMRGLGVCLITAAWCCAVLLWGHHHR